MSTVTQADRDAAEALWSAEGVGVSMPPYFAEAFAAHRTSSQVELLEALEIAELWLTAALECKEWHWDADQYEAATESRDTVRTAISNARSNSMVSGRVRGE